MRNRVQELRWKKDLSQGQLEIKSGVSKSVINRLENNETATTGIEYSHKLAKALGVTIEELFNLV